jgi:hypothetical protein
VTLVPDNNARAGIVNGVKVGVAPAVAPLLGSGRCRTDPIWAAASPRPSAIRRSSIREDFGTTRLDYNLSQNDTLFGVYTVDDSFANTPSANPLSSVLEGPARAGGERAGTARFLAEPAQYGARGLLARQLFLHRRDARRSARMGGRAIPSARW